jgi:spermidine synthase
MDAAQHPAAGLGDWTAAALVFGSSGAVLVVELAALRLLAPYFGLTLETNTLIIGLALAAIAIGSWMGGRAADRFAPRALLGPLLAVSGGAVALLPAVVRGTGAADPSSLLLASALGIGVPTALLSAVTPVVTTLRLTTLAETGTVVGRLSGIGTLGAIAGTVLTGFVLVSLVPVSAILVGLGAVLVVVSVLVDLRLRSWRGPASAAAVVSLAALAAPVVPGGCDVETSYHCAEVRVDGDRPSGRLLVLDGLGHSYVDLDDPTHLEFDYTAAIASVVDVSFPAAEPLEAYHLGAGGLTVPRYLEHARPGTSSLVSEVDDGVVEIAVERLGVEPGPDLEIRVEDGRTALAELPAASRDLVVGDAFGGVSVPFHLATREALVEVDRVLAPEGLYVANLIDHPPLGFARAELATALSVFDHVSLAAAPATVAGEDGGNLVAVAGDRPVDLDRWLERLDGRDVEWHAITGAELDRWVGQADVLTDDHAPVDQLLTPYG